MIARYAGLQRAVPSLLRTIEPQVAAAALRGPAARRHLTITSVAAPERPEKLKSKPEAHHVAAFSSFAAAGEPIPYTALSVGQCTLMPCRHAITPAALGLGRNRACRRCR